MASQLSSYTQQVPRLDRKKATEKKKKSKQYKKGINGENKSKSPI